MLSWTLCLLVCGSGSFFGPGARFLLREREFIYGLCLWAGLVCSTHLSLGLRIGPY